MAVQVLFLSLSSIQFNENTVNASPELVFAGPLYSGYATGATNGSLTVTGLLAEDVLAVRNQGQQQLQIGVSGADISYSGGVFGTLSGGDGTSLTVDLNDNTTSATIEALLANLTHATASDAPARHAPSRSM